MVIKSRSIHQHVANMEEIFGEPSKYGDGGKFLGFMITHQGIKANLNKCTAILEMRSPTNIQEVQKLNGRLASLSRFLPKLAEKAKPFYKLLKETEPLSWDETC